MKELQKTLPLWAGGALLGILLATADFQIRFWIPTLLVLLLAVLILAARRKRVPQRWLSDLYIFLSFGVVAVMGTYMAVSQTVFLRLLLPAAAAGCFAVVALDEQLTRPWLLALLALGWVCMTAYCLLRWHSWWHYLFVLSLPLFLLRPRSVWPSLAFCLLAGAGFCMHLL